MLMMSYMQMIYIDSTDNAWHTGVGAAMETNRETRTAFNRHRHFDVPKERATFLLDYYNAKGDLCETIFLDDAGFGAITGEPVKTEAEYCRIDEKYWAETRKAHDARLATDGSRE
jgi:hypothetical protein